jgi:F-type H+-transporting ATPase subunit epsilon
VPVEVHLVTPEDEVWSGPAEMVIARGVEGEVGILAGHAPLLIQLGIGPFRIQEETGDWVKAVVDGGFLHVTSEDGETRVDVLATGAELADAVDLEAARARKERAEQFLAGRSSEPEDPETDGARTELQKAEARLSLAD